MIWDFLTEIRRVWRSLSVFPVSFAFIFFITKLLKCEVLMATKTKQSAIAKRVNGTKSISQEVQKPLKNSFYEKNKHLIGSLSADIPDLSSNKEHLKGFGRSRNAGHS
jgi:hypothetical protein